MVNKINKLGILEKSLKGIIKLIVNNALGA
jgi:hypothetical protein